MLLKDQTSAHLADLFSALSDPTRLRIVSLLLDGERNVGDLAIQLQMTESAVSHQLRGNLSDIHFTVEQDGDNLQTGRVTEGAEQVSKVGGSVIF